MGTEHVGSSSDNYDPPTQFGWIQEAENGGYSIQYDTDKHVLIRVSKFT